MLNRIAVVTGATGGIGYFTAEGLARAGWTVVLTGRDPAKGKAALARLHAALPNASARFALLDVGSLAAVARFAETWEGPLGLLVNNAGVMGYPTRRVTEDGFEAQLGINYLGHFALTLRLLPALLAAPGARVVNVSSLAHRRAQFDFDDLQGAYRYSPFKAYSQSKLAMLVFARALQRRAGQNGWDLASIAAHPGWSATAIVSNGLGASPWARLAQAGFSALGQSAEAGARPIVYAALDPAASPGGYYGPAHLGETRGPVAPSRVMPQAADVGAADRLWAESERLTGVHLPGTVAAL